MVTDDRSDPATPQGSGRKKRPPVIELKATDVTPETPADTGAGETSAPPQEESPEPAQAAAADAAPAGGEQGPSSSPSSNPSPSPSSRRAALLAGVTGALAGALVLALALVFLFAGDAVKRMLAPAETAAVPASDGPAIERLQKADAGYEKRLSALEDRKPADLAPLTARLDRMEQTLSGIRQLVEQGRNDAASAGEALAGRIAAMEAQLAKPPRSGAAHGAEIVALGALHDAIVRGVPFEKQLRVARALLGDGAAPLAPLERLAGTGVPTMAALRAQFAALAPKLAHEPRTESGYFSRLLSSAGRLVEVRPVGEAQGTSAGAVTARIETRLAANDLAAALDEAARLPASVKPTAAAWIESATGRRDAEAAVNNLLNGALARAAAEAQP